MTINKTEIDTERSERSEKLQQSILNLMIEMKDMYSTYQEYKTIIMNLTTVSKELNSIRIKEITGEITTDILENNIDAVDKLKNNIR